MADSNEAVVLVVEDSPTNLIALKALLSHLGVEADYVPRGREAVAAVERNRYRIVFMDLMMPGMDGFEASKLIRKLEYGTGRHTPIVAVTALDPELSTDLCIDAGINDLVRKPLDQDKLRAQLARWVTASRRGDERQRVAPAARLPEQTSAAAMRRIYGVSTAEEILDSFLGVTDALLQNLSQAIESKDLEAATYFAHEVKGSSLTVYASEMARLAFLLEEAIRAQNWIDVLKCYSALVADFKRLTEDLKTPVKGILQRSNGKSEIRQPH